MNRFVTFTLVCGFALAVVGCSTDGNTVEKHETIEISEPQIIVE